MALFSLLNSFVLDFPPQRLCSPLLLCKGFALPCFVIPCSTSPFASTILFSFVLPRSNLEARAEVQVRMLQQFLNLIVCAFLGLCSVHLALSLFVLFLNDVLHIWLCQYAYPTSPSPWLLHCRLDAAIACYLLFACTATGIFCSL